MGVANTDSCRSHILTISFLGHKSDSLVIIYAVFTPDEVALGIETGVLSCYGLVDIRNHTHIDFNSGLAEDFCKRNNLCISVHCRFLRGEVCDHLHIIEHLLDSKVGEREHSHAANAFGFFCKFFKQAKFAIIRRKFLSNFRSSRTGFVQDSSIQIRSNLFHCVESNRSEKVSLL